MIYGIYGIDTRRKPCPFCGSTHLRQEELITGGVVICEKCRAAMASRKSLADAQQKWDKRKKLEK